MWYTLRVDTPLIKEWYMSWLLKTIDPVRDYLMVACETSAEGKEHIHTIMYVSDETQKETRSKFGNYRARLEKEHPSYYKKTYKDSSKIQTFSLAKVRKFSNCKKYMTKDGDIIYYPSKQKWCEKFNESLQNSKEAQNDENKSKMLKWINNNSQFIKDCYLDEHCSDWIDSMTKGDGMETRHALDSCKSSVLKIFSKMFMDIGHIERMKNLFYKVLLEKELISAAYYCSVIYRI